MSRSPRFAEVIRLLRQAVQAEAHGRPAAEVVGAGREARRVRLIKGASRREFLAATSRIAAMAAGASALGSARAMAAGSRGFA